jgi:serine/threonine-protein kinase
VTTAARACPSCNTTLPPEAQFCMSCGTATPTDPGVPPRMATTGAIEVAQVTQALAGRYRIERVIGEGGMATVYLAEDARHKRKVAVKVMRPELAATLGADRFLREVEIAARLQHPHILALYDSGESNGLLFYVMPLVEGESLKDRLAREGALPADEALKLGREIAEALAYAHKRGIVHRDIKPANILLNEGHALIADFGIARAVEDVGGESLTKTGLAVGTPQYMAPEQATGEKDVDGRADVYATGAVLYEMLAGEPPFTGANARAVLTKSLTETPRALSAVRAGVTDAVDAVVQKALAKGVADRFATADAFANAIDAVRSRTSGTMEAVTSAEIAATQVTAAAQAPAGVRKWVHPRNLLVAGLVAAVLFFALRGRGGGDGGSVASGAKGNRVAVLPFRNEAGPSDAFLVDGIAQDVRDRLGRAGALVTIGWTSTSDYRDTQKPPQDIGRELGADHLLRGVVRWAGQGGARRLLVVPELIDARSGRQVWQRAVEHPEPDIPRMSSDVTRAVTEALGVALTPGEDSAIAELPTRSAEAYRAFLRGREQTGSDPATLRATNQEYEQAVALDSMFADAWGSLSSGSTILYLNGNRDPAVARRAREAMERVVALRPGSALARRARSRYLEIVAGDEPAARAEMDLALRENPNDATLLAMSGQQDINVGDLGSGLTKLERARELDPRSPSVLTNLVQAYTYLNRPTDAQKAGVSLLAVRPLDLNAIQGVAMAHVSAGDLEGARRVLRDAVQRGVPAPRLAAHMTGYLETGFVLEDAEQQLVLRLTPSTFDDDRAWWAQALATLYWQRGDTAMARVYADSALGPTRAQMAGAPNDPQLHGLIALMYAYLGRAADARSEVQQSMAHVDRFSQQGYNRTNAAKTELALGNRDAAIDHLAKVRVTGYHLTNGWLQVDPTFASLKGYPKFEQMLKGN